MAQIKGAEQKTPAMLYSRSGHMTNVANQRNLMCQESSCSEAGTRKVPERQMHTKKAAVPLIVAGTELVPVKTPGIAAFSGVAQLNNLKLNPINGINEI